MDRAQERFRNMRLVEQYDTRDPKGNRLVSVIEIVAAPDIVFALTHSGVCASFSRDTNKRVCFLNVSPDEVIRSLFYNKNNDSLITVSVYASDNFNSLKCRSTRIEFILRGQADAGFPIFESESLKWPGFVEFDDVNGKVLTYSAQDSVYKVFDLKNYEMLHSISDKNVQEIKISPGIMLLIFKRATTHVPLKILSIEDGTVLKSFNHLLHPNKDVDFIEQFNEKLLVKQENENLQILDVRNAEMIEVSRTEFMTPSAFIFLYEKQLFLTFRNRNVSVWNFHGELVTSFEDHILWHPDCNTNNIYITNDQDLIISYCKAEGNVGSINISNILTGKCLAKIKASNGFPKEDECSSSLGKSKERKTAVAEALVDITALFYDEEPMVTINGKVLTYSAQDIVYKVFDLKNYAMLHSISDKNVQEIKISPGTMLLIFKRATTHVPLKILSIEDGTVLKSFNHLLHPNKEVDFIELFNEKLLVKQENENLQILDVRNAEMIEVSRTEFMTPSAFIFLYEKQLFLTFRNRNVSVWNFHGELVTSFEDHILWHPDCNTNNIYITSDQDLIISYCKAEGNAGSINISNILTGKCLAKIKASNGLTKEEECSSSLGKFKERKTAVAEALEDITALFYDEERNEIYTGNRHGLLHVWSN